MCTGLVNILIRAHFIFLLRNHQLLTWSSWSVFTLSLSVAGHESEDRDLDLKDVSEPQVSDFPEKCP